MDLALQTIPGAHGASLDSSLLQRDAEVAVVCRSGIPRVMYGLARGAGQCQAPGHRDISIPLEWCRVCQQPGSAFAPRHFSPPARGMEQSSAAGCPVVFSPHLRAVGEPDPCPQIGHSNASKAREWGGVSECQPGHLQLRGQAAWCLEHVLSCSVIPREHEALRLRSCISFRCCAPR